MKRQSLLVSLAFVGLMAMAQTSQRTIDLRILHTSDVHSHVFDGLSAIERYADLLRAEMPGRVVLTDGGDVLQGHPTAYYYNFIDTTSVHFIAEAMNHVRYDVAAIGNHDIETGHRVYDRWIADCQFPIVGANVIDEATDRPWLKPYVVVEREGIRMAFLGMLTPAIPNWLPRNLWTGLRFEEMVSCARRWVPYIQEHERPDLLIGLFHSGWDDGYGIRTPDYVENASRLVAEQVPGFDLVLYGHDHQRRVQRVVNSLGDSVLCCGPTSTGATLCDVSVRLLVADGHVVHKDINAELVSLRDSKSKTSSLTAMPPADPAYFPQQYAAIQAFMNQQIGTFDTAVHESEAFFGSSAFIDLIHELQFEVAPQAQISLAAPLSFDAVIGPGPVTMADMFALYKYENLLYTMRLTGREVLGHLEMSYDLWCNTMQSADDHIMLLDYNLDNERRQGLKNLAFNFDSAAGIRYTVDVTKPNGHKVHIESMADGTPFSPDSVYLVAVNSYRGNGGGELLTRGAGIPQSELASRIVSSTDHDLRYHLMQLIRKRGHVSPKALNQWRFVPDEWARPAIERDRRLLFPKK